MVHAGKLHREGAPEPVVLPFRGSDAQLLELVRSGAPQAGRLVFDRFAPDVQRLVWHVFGPDPEHDDVVQMAFERIFDSMHKVRDGSRLRSWVASVTVNVARSELRRRRLRRTFFPARSSDEPLELWHVDDHEGRELVRRTYALLERMPAQERIALVLKHMDGYPIEELAAVCECSLATVHRRLAKARRRFSELAKRQGLGERLAQSEDWKGLS
jgi:RNA polymerase sigma-70 factor (ECF subfamily)